MLYNHFTFYNNWYLRKTFIVSNKNVYLWDHVTCFKLKLINECKLSNSWNILNNYFFYLQLYKKKKKKRIGKNSIPIILNECNRRIQNINLVTYNIYNSVLIKSWALIFLFTYMSIHKIFLTKRSLCKEPP